VLGRFLALRRGTAVSTDRVAHDHHIEPGQLEYSSHLILGGSQSKFATALKQTLACCHEDGQARRVEEGHRVQVHHDPALERIEAFSKFVDGGEVDFASEDDYGSARDLGYADVELWEPCWPPRLFCVSALAINVEHGYLLRQFPIQRGAAP
jgi:hypothetical protein